MIYDSLLWFEDIDKVSQDLPELSELAGKSVFITGAAGLICSAVVDIFIRYNETHDIPISIIAAGRGSKKISERFGEYFDRDYFSYVRYDAAKTDNKIDRRADYIIHGASNAYPKAIVAEPVETMFSNFNGLGFLLEHAKQNGTKRLLYISSSEVYGTKNDSKPFQEEDYGYIDLLKPRNAYSVGKRAAETLCASYYAEYGVDSVIVRPGHIYGPTASPQDDRISSAFAYAAARGERLVMKSAGTQLRSYCHCLDCASAIIKMLIKGKAVQAYNISVPDHVISIRQLAESIAKAGKVDLVIEAATEKEKEGFNPMSCSAIDGKKLAGLGWHSKIDLEYGLASTVKILQVSTTQLEI